MVCPMASLVQTISLNSSSFIQRMQPCFMQWLLLLLLRVFRGHGAGYQQVRGIGGLG